MFKNLLAAVDFSEPSRAALKVAIEIARRTPDAKITVLHLHSVPVYAYTEGIVFPAAVLAQLESAAHDAVAKLCREHADSGVPLHPVSELGSPLDIVERAEKDGVDMIVMGTHGRTGLPHFLLGSFSEKVVRTAPCPVLTVRGTDAVKKTGLQKILVATDLTDTSRSAIRQAFELARQVGAAEVIALHVSEPVYSITRSGVEFAASETEMLEALRLRQSEADRAALRMQAEEAAGVNGKKVAHRTLVVDGIPADAIVSVAAENGADIVVMGTHGRRGARHWLLGSIAEHVIRASPIPVLTVRPEKTPA